MIAPSICKWSHYTSQHMVLWYKNPVHELPIRHWLSEILKVFETMGGGYSIPATKHPDIPIFMISFSERQVCVFNAEERALFLCRDILQKDYWGVEEEKTLDDVILFKVGIVVWARGWKSNIDIWIRRKGRILKNLILNFILKKFLEFFEWEIRIPMPVRCWTKSSIASPLDLRVHQKNGIYFFCFFDEEFSKLWTNPKLWRIFKCIFFPNKCSNH